MATSGSLAVTTRRGFGMIGPKVRAATNYFDIDISGMKEIFKYSLAIRSKDKDDAQISKRIQARIIFLLLQTTQSPWRYAASDYVNRVYSVRPLTGTDERVCIYQVDYFEPEEPGPRPGERQLVFQVTVQLTQTLSIQHLQHYLNNPQGGLTNEEEYITAFNLLISRAVNQNPRMATMQRSAKFFDMSKDATRESPRVYLGGGVDTHRGFFRAAKLTLSGLKLNLNVAAAAMIEDKHLDHVIKEMLDHRLEDTANGRRRLAVLEQWLKSARVELTYTRPRARRTFFKFPQSSAGFLPKASRISFVRDIHPQTKARENKPVSVLQHFRDAYSQSVHNDTLVADVGNIHRPCLIPCSLLRVLPGNPFRGLLPLAAQTSKMINFAARWPPANRNYILNEGLQQLGVPQHLTKEDPFQMSIKRSMTNVNARLLPPPTAVFGTPIPAAETEKIQSGKWNMMHKRFLRAPDRGACKISWVEVLWQNQRPASDRDVFFQTLRRDMQRYTNGPFQVVDQVPGLKQSIMCTQHVSIDTLNKVWKAMLAQGISLVVVLLPEKSKANYVSIKRSAETMAGIQTVCYVAESGRCKSAAGLIANLALKINMKLGGLNLGLMPGPLEPILSRKIMFVGADVTHPSSNSMQAAPSIAGVVATTGQDLLQYAGRLSLQQHRDDNKRSIETILRFSDMVADLVRVYSKKNNTLPEYIFIYRDGVANGMFQDCLDRELAPAMRSLSAIYGSRPLPRFMFIVVQKRHHTRFYQDNSHQRQGFDKNGNIVPGFIVDTIITEPSAYDWFCSSHVSIKGTSKPAHYTILWDNTDLMADQIQLLTHHSSWLVSRTTNSISTHPAARYADMLCDRARLYLEEVYNAQPSSNGDPRPTYNAGEHWCGTVAGPLINTMFWI